MELNLIMQKDILITYHQITTKNNIPTPVLSASFNWFYNLTSVDNPSNLIQAQRDFFGRHKVQKVDSSADINIDWD